MSGTKIVVGLDGSEASKRVLGVVTQQAKAMGACEVIACYVIEWSPFTFQTAEENAQRHKRREEEISVAKERVVDPAMAKLSDAGVNATALVRHGNVADTLDAVARELGADQIIVARSSDNGLSSRIFGSATANLVMSASVPVTVVA